MSKELVISSNHHETKVGVLEDDQLVEVFFQRANEYSLAGSIHKGRVTRVLPGMQSAFVDLGLERDTFLYVSDFFEEHPEEFDPVTDSTPARPARDNGVRDNGPRETGSGEREATGGPESRERDQRDRRDRDRRDRGGRDRGPRQDRPGGRFEAQRAGTGTVGGLPASSATTITESVVPEAGAVAEPFAGSELPLAPATESGISPSETGMSQEVRPFDRPNGDRDRDRGGDRRRRSRRRRSRGQGFPDTKYAQPGVGSAPAFVQPASHNLTSETSSGQSETESPEIILLPGESLAKYRNAPPASPLVESVPALVDEPADIEDDSDDEPEGYFSGFAEEAHTEVESSEEEHEALTGGEGATIRPELEILTASVEAASRRQPLVFEAAQPITLAPEGKIELQNQPEEKAEAHHEPLREPESPLPMRGHVSHEREERRYEIHLAAQLADEVRGDKVEPEIADDEDLEVPSYLEEELADAETVFPGALDAGEADAFEGDESEEGEREDGEVIELEAAIAESIEPAEQMASGTPQPPQQAFVREQGHRAPHRIGRRMRRRRGGRGGQFSNEGGLPTSQPSSTEGGTTLGPASSLDAGLTEARVETRLEGDFRAEAHPEARIEQRSGDERPRSESMAPSIADLLKPGQEIIVQIAKEPLGQKGARITSHIALPGRYVVFMPSVDHLGVSRKIASDEERLRLKRILQAHRVGTSGGFICRTAGEGRTEDEIAADMSFLYNLWLDIRQKAEKRPAPTLLHHDLDVVQRILRDQLTDEYKAIWVDNEDLYESALRFVQRFQPALVGRVKMYTRSAPIFDAFGITQELEKALRPKVWLKSGGYIVINQTEALVAIDVNTGKYVGKSNRLEDTIVKTNTEAVKEIVRQVRLRDLGGIIVVDFIDMDERKNRQKVMTALEEAMRADKAPYKILQFNDFGLVAITRKRVKQSLERTLCAPCPYCEGAGYVKSVQTIIGEILVEAQKIARAVEGKDVMLRVHPDVAKILKSNNNRYLEELEEILGRPVLVTGDAALHHEKFDLA